MKIRIIRNLKLKNRRVLVRVDFNTPLDKKGNIKDDRRIRQALPTIKYLIKNKAKIILMTHLGRPNGKKIKKLQTDKLARRLAKLLKKKIKKLDNCIGPKVEKQIQNLKPGKIILLENLRFHKQETRNSKTFAKALSKLADVYIDDAFGVIHRNHASITGITNYLPGGIGFLVEKEIKALSRLKKPFTAIIGGIKKGKIKSIKKLIPKTDYIILGSAMSKKAKTKNKKLILPMDFTRQNSKIMDLGPESIKNIKKILKKSKKVFWAGPLGFIEKKKCAKATIAIARFLAKSRAFTVVGGGETAEVIDKLKLSNKFSHISTGGGAAIEFVEGTSLAGIKALEKNRKKFR